MAGLIDEALMYLMCLQRELDLDEGQQLLELLHLLLYFGLALLEKLDIINCENEAVITMELLF